MDIHTVMIRYRFESVIYSGIATYIEATKAVA